MISTRHTLRPGRPLWLFVLLFLCILPHAAQAQQENRLRHIRISRQPLSTRISLFFQDTPDYTVSVLPGRVRVTVRNADSPLFRRLRGYADQRIGGVFCSQRYRGLNIVIPVKQGSGVQTVGDGSILTLVVAPERAQQPDIAPGREAILNGTERFVRDFAVPPRAGLPFAPTEPELLQRILPEADAKLFQRGEGFLYKEQGKEALEIFALFLKKEPAVQALAWYRVGEALALQQRDKEAVAAFQRGEALWPGYLQLSPELLQVYAELRGRSGDFNGGRQLLMRLVDRFSGTGYLPPLLNRLAGLWERHGDTAYAMELYRTVAVHAPGSEAATRARMKLVDREMFTLPRDRYRELVARYRALYEAPGDLALRDEALFKMALLHSLYGPAPEALQAAASYQTRYPHGIFSTIVKKMREELLLPVYQEIYATKEEPDPKGGVEAKESAPKEPKESKHQALARLALDNKEYLARCFSDPQFAPRLADAFRRAGMLTQEVKLFGYLADRSWALPAAPYLACRLIDDALTLGDTNLAEASARGFLARFPGDGRAQHVREQLGRIAFEKGDLKAVVAELSFLNEKGKQPEFPESDYYLGKALAAAGDQRGAERSLARFTAAAPENSPLVTDGFFAVAGARVALKEYPAALAAYQQGARLAKGEEADHFLYKTGELYLKLNMVRQARDTWQKVAGHDGGGTWVKLASESLSDLTWRLKIAGQLP